MGKWKNIVAISAGFRGAVGLKSNGTAVATGYARIGKNWKKIKLPADRDALLAAIELSYITEE